MAVTRPEDKDLLTKLFDEVDELMDPKIRSPWKRVRKRQIKRTDTDGWHGELARNGGITFEVWIDRWASGKDGLRQWWYGFAGETPMARRAIAEAAHCIDPEIRVLNDEAQTRSLSIRGHTSLAEKIDLEDFDEIIWENYEWERTAFLGVFSRNRSLNNPPYLLADEIVEFFSTHSAEFVDSEPLIYPKEGQDKVVTHLRKERSNSFVRNMKAAQGPACAVCRTDPREIYGKEVGETIVDAHHLIPLKDCKKPRRPQRQDFALVCPNCHRALHRLKSGTSAVSVLRRLVKRNRARNEAK